MEGSKFKFKSKSKELRTRKKQRCCEDWISRMPDEILVCILSRLSMRESARSSVLSRRWRFLWTFTPRLDFDNSQLAYQLIYNGKVETTVEVERPRFVKWVNDVLRLNKAPTLDEFIICFDVDVNTNKSDLDRWMGFAFEKRAKLMEFSLLSCQGHLKLEKYRITPQFLSNYNLTHLIVCRFESVDLTEQVLEHILSSCLHLEELIVIYAKSLVRAKVCGPSLKLKHLEVLGCRSLTSVEISAVNLAYFRYHGPNLRISFNLAPRLSELSFMHPRRSFLINNVQTQFSHLPQFKTLLLNYKLKGLSRIPEFPDFQNLKKLVLQLVKPDAATPEFWVSKLESFPKLQEFSLELFQIIGGEKVELPKTRKSRKVKVPKNKFEHQCLKVFELRGFLPIRYHIELVWGVLRNTRAVEKIIIDSGKALDPDIAFAAGMYAEFLKKKLPPGAQLLHLQKGHPQRGDWNTYIFKT